MKILEMGTVLPTQSSPTNTLQQVEMMSQPSVWDLKIGHNFILYIQSTGINNCTAVCSQTSKEPGKLPYELEMGWNKS